MKQLCSNTCLVKVLMVLSMLFSYCNIDAQIRPKSLKINPDSIFSVARDSAYAKNYLYSRELCRKVLRINPEYSDVKIFVGRTYAWEQKYDSARVIFKDIWVKDSSNSDLLEAYVDLETWSNRPDTALKICDSALFYYPNKNEFLNRKAKLLMQKNRFDEAKINLDKSLEQNPNDTIALQLLSDLKQEADIYINRLSIEYSIDYFDNPYLRRWQMLSINYMRKFKRSVVIGRVIEGFLYAPFLQKKSTMFEAEWYPQMDTLGRRTGYFSFGISTGFPFPRFRGGAEVYQSLGAGFEASLGARYMYYVNNDKSKDVFVITASIGKYLGNFFFSFRPYLTPNGKEASKSYVLLGRYYIKNKNNYVFAEYNWGEFPEEPSNINLNLTSNNIFSGLFKFGASLRVEKRWWIYGALGLGSEDLPTGISRNTALFELKLGYYF